MPSPNTSGIDAVARDVAALALKPAGFARRGRTCFRQQGDLYHAVHFQGSRWSAPPTASFTVNLSVHWPAWHEAWAGTPFPTNIGSAAPVIGQRLGLLMPGNRDRWWDVGPQAPPENAVSDVVANLEQFGLPFLARWTGSAGLLEAIDAGRFPTGLTAAPLVRAVLLAGLNRRAEATAEIEAAKQSSPKWAGPNLVAVRLGLTGAA